MRFGLGAFTKEGTSASTFLRARIALEFYLRTTSWSTKTDISKRSGRISGSSDSNRAGSLSSTRRELLQPRLSRNLPAEQAHAQAV